jgi:hypothetical protein
MAGLRRVSDAGPFAIDQPGLRAGVRKPPGKEPAVGGVGVAVYGDLTAERRAQLARWSVEQTAAIRLQQSERSGCGFRQGVFGVTGGIARVFSGHAATGLRRRKRHAPAGGRRDKVSAAVMMSRS